MLKRILLSILCLASWRAWASDVPGDCRLAPVASTVNSIRIMVDPRVELMSVVQFIGGYQGRYPVLLTKYTSSYRGDVERAFAAHRDDAAPALVDRLSQRGFNFNRPPFIMLHMDGEFGMRPEIVPDAFAVELSGGDEQVRELGREMARFCRDAGFATFYEQHRAYYEGLVERASRCLEGRDYVREIESFYGVHQTSYTLVLVSLYGTVGFGPHLVTRDRGREVYNILGPAGVTSDSPDFGTDKDYFQKMQRHEFSHPFVNPLALRYRAEVSRLAPLFQRMPEVARKGMCGDWEECLNEQVVRAVTTHLAFSDSQAAGQQALAWEKSRGAVFLDDLLAGVREYAAARERYPTFESYYPTLLRRLETYLKPPAE
jgi:hypothetical protein